MPGQLDLRANNNINSNQDFAVPTTPGAYVDLPNGTISSLGTRATFEAWITVETNRTWDAHLRFWPIRRRRELRRRCSK